MLCLLGGAMFVLMPACQSPWQGPRGAGLAVCRVVPCLAVLVVCALVPQCGYRQLGWPGLVAFFLGSLSLSLPQVFSDPVSWCSTSLNLLLSDITCTRVVCPDAGTPFSGVMRAGCFHG